VQFHLESYGQPIHLRKGICLVVGHVRAEIFSESERSHALITRLHKFGHEFESGGECLQICLLLTKCFVKVLQLLKFVFFELF